MKSINVQGEIFVLCRVEFSKIGKRGVTFIREMRVGRRYAYLGVGQKCMKMCLRMYCMEGPLAIKSSF